MEREQVRVEQTKVGDRYVLELMRACGYTLGGEQSGHVVMSDHSTTGDGTLTAVHLLSRVAETGRPLKDLAAVMTRLPQILVNVPGVDKNRTDDLELAAAVAVAEDDFPRAARLWGAARALSSAGGVRLADFVDEQYEFYSRPNARFTLPPEELERYAEEGRRMTLDESVAYALGTTVDELAPHDHAGVA